MMITSLHTWWGIQQMCRVYPSSICCMRNVSDGSQELWVIATDQTSWLPVDAFYILGST